MKSGAAASATILLLGGVAGLSALFVEWLKARGGSAFSQWWLAELRPDDLANGAWNDAATHRVCFTGAGLTVCEYGDIESLKETVEKRLHRLDVYILLFGIRIVHLVKGKCLFSAT